MTPAQTDVERVDRVAAALWRAETVDAGVPTSVTNARTLEAFADLDPDHRARFHKFARAAIAAHTPSVAEAAKVLGDGQTAQTKLVEGIEDEYIKGVSMETAVGRTLRALSKETDDDNA